MYAEAGEPHHVPHFHAYHQNQVAVFGISPIKVIAGDLPTRSRRLVEAWAGLHHDELLVDWKRLQAANARCPLSLCNNMPAHHPIFRVESFRLVAPYTLEVALDDGSRQTIDFRPVLSGELYGPLRDLALFNRVQIDPEVRTLVWPNGADFDPATLHDWPKYAEALTTRARKWESQPA